ncbi:MULTISPECIES: hypothetical protein [Delftia]|jgi:hypothetical protein|uniref:Uncharacterized protein n=1 Tax=Delftia deserti TaxID=1651218 RepID=A0ABW5ETU8_9BURK|nr:hypothetical protein [Delftia sp. CH05]MXN28154.1 hypothetical protein [Delftia sp. CH05]
MTGKSRPDALLAKNARRFDAMTQAIEDALKKIESDRRLKTTEESLAELVGCSRGTLRNRGWPLTQLGDIKTAREQKRDADKSEQPKPAAAKAESETDRLKNQLQLSRTENARLHAKNELLRKELQQTKDLLAEVTRLTRNTRLDATPSRSKGSPAKVVPLRERAAAKSDEGPSKR